MTPPTHPSCSVPTAGSFFVMRSYVGPRIWLNAGPPSRPATTSRSRIFVLPSLHPPGGSTTWWWRPFARIERGVSPAIEAAGDAAFPLPCHSTIQGATVFLLAFPFSTLETDTLRSFSRTECRPSFALHQPGCRSPLATRGIVPSFFPLPTDPELH